MTHPLLTALRRLVLPRVIKGLSIRDIPSVPMEPEPDQDQETNDTWMFAAPKPVSDYVDDYTLALTGLGGTLGNLRALTTRMAAAVPAPADENYALAPSAMGAVWSDTVLFDGEPAPLETRVPLQVSGDAGAFLFEDRDQAAPDLPVAELHAGLQLPMPEPAPIWR